MDITQLLTQARQASKELLRLTDANIHDILNTTAEMLVRHTDSILSANAKDLAKLSADNPKYDRLRLTPERISDIAADMSSVASLPSPCKEIDRRIRPNGLVISRRAVPFGVIGVIYEARPNVTADVFGLCFKSGNACVLKGGHDAAKSNEAIANVIHNVLEASGVNPGAMTLLPPTREATEQLLKARGLVDLIIPRGSASLIESVREKSRVPVIETGAGVCHCYIHEDADTDMAARIVDNAKTRRVSVCNALDCIICHAGKLGELPQICQTLAQKDVMIHADERAYKALKGSYPDALLVSATDDDFGTEYLSYALAIKTVDCIDEALQHIDRYGSGHSESCVTANPAMAQKFQHEVDAACVYANAPTSFTDGAQFGLGAEIGISTQKLHARGPMGLDELMTKKWFITGQGQTRK